jgi:hypothetical protein
VSEGEPARVCGREWERGRGEVPVDDEEHLLGGVVRRIEKLLRLEEHLLVFARKLTDLYRKPRMST